MNEQKQKTKEELVLYLKECLCKYTLFHKKKTPSEIYMPLDFTEKCLQTFKEVIEHLKEVKKDILIDYINPIDHSYIKVYFDGEKERRSINIHSDGKIVTEHMTSVISTNEGLEQTKDFISKI